MKKDFERPGLKFPDENLDYCSITKEECCNLEKHMFDFMREYMAKIETLERGDVEDLMFSIQEAKRILINDHVQCHCLIVEGKTNNSLLVIMAYVIYAYTEFYQKLEKITAKRLQVENPIFQQPLGSC